jgi:CubicO group peptidase (beta-lactamase class C family)
MGSLSSLIQERLDRAVSEKVFPGCVAGVADRFGVRLIIPFGRFTYEESEPEVRESTIYDTASITKAIPLSCLALRLIEEGRLHPGKRLIEFVPELLNPDREEVLIQHLLTHTLHFGFPLSSLREGSPEDIMDAILKRPFHSKPGRFFSYANATSLLLGLVVERLYGESLEEAAQGEFFSPLRMTRTAFRPLEKFKKEEIVPTEVDPRRGGTLQGEVHDESAWVLSHSAPVKEAKTIPSAFGGNLPVPCTPGSAGLFSTASDLLQFLQMLLKGGSHEGRRYFSEDTVRRMHTNQIPHLHLSTGLGWELNQPRFMGRYSSANIFGKTGFTGCSCLCDPEKRLGLVLLSNCTYPARAPDREAINAVRRDVADLVFSR